ncbi:hypothetical protein PoB_001275800 [Plakobranchus ocellatus]|uniref:Uncharacterized protein n=1 Tax=Plakobranchus ocellatus TaxID=259542 RepID=A0AAV3YUL4_9GAST|nr:hypothetical protein PoB_001275800 [Plakobranchus ocellatus]
MSQAFRFSVRPGHQWRGSNLRQKSLCRSQAGITILCATNTPIKQRISPTRITSATANSAAFQCGGVGGIVDSESALRSAGTLLSRVRAPLSAPWPDGGSESLRSPCCGLAIFKKKASLSAITNFTTEAPGDVNTGKIRCLIQFRLQFAFICTQLPCFVYNLLHAQVSCEVS